MQPAIHIYKNLNDLHESIASLFVNASHEGQRSDSLFSIALPGGSTPRTLFKYLSEVQVTQKIFWKYLQFFWGDERCVHPSHPESNFGLAKKSLLNHIKIPRINVHRIYGENDPDGEAIRYFEEIRKNVKNRLNSIPRFDWIILGLGIDGHTASLFPGQIYEELCAVAVHPESGQKRITVNYKLINHAQRISFFVRGIEKAAIIAKILKEPGAAHKIPAAKIQPVNGIIEWHIDEDAASYL